MTALHEDDLAELHAWAARNGVTDTLALLDLQVVVAEMVTDNRAEAAVVADLVGIRHVIINDGRPHTCRDLGCEGLP